jgi:hypothetical protein
VTVSRHHARPVAVPGYAPRITGNDAPIIDWRASRMRAYGRPANEVCPDEACGCLLEAVPAHSPRCKA